jgi:hypothetical protein
MFRPVTGASASPDRVRPSGRRHAELSKGQEHRAQRARERDRLRPVVWRSIVAYGLVLWWTGVVVLLRAVL